MHKCCEYLRIIYAFQQAKMAGVRTITFTVKLINLGADPSHRRVITVCDPCLPFSMLEEWIKSGKMLAPLQA